MTVLQPPSVDRDEKTVPWSPRVCLRAAASYSRLCLRLLCWICATPQTSAWKVFIDLLAASSTFLCLSCSASFSASSESCLLKISSLIVSYCLASLIESSSLICLIILESSFCQCSSFYTSNICCLFMPLLFFFAMSYNALSLLEHLFLFSTVLYASPSRHSPLTSFLILWLSFAI